MQILKFQSKGQVTLPKQIVGQFHLDRGDVLKCEVRNSHIILTPVDIEERYAEDELQAIDQIVESGKGKGIALNSDKDIDRYIKKMTSRKSPPNGR
ncbi:MAG: AbrB/MazE/SpoVT family DNA-binding domain-containing protein [Nitrospirae bacterium]|nr:AbrB/MazE/SpoVT family DNA-binding domain-containing protein [Nitrospirota bacterium]